MWSSVTVVSIFLSETNHIFKSTNISKLMWNKWAYPGAFFVSKIYGILNYVEGVGAGEHTCLHRSEEEARSPDATGTDNCKSPGINTGNWT